MREFVITQRSTSDLSQNMSDPQWMVDVRCSFRIFPLLSLVLNGSKVSRGDDSRHVIIAHFYLEQKLSVITYGNVLHDKKTSERNERNINLIKFVLFLSPTKTPERNERNISFIKFMFFLSHSSVIITDWI